MREVYSSFNVRKINCVVQEVLLSTLFTHSLWIEDIKRCYCLDMCRCTWDANFVNLKHTRHTTNMTTSTALGLFYYFLFNSCLQ